METAKNASSKMFGVQFYGECWSGADAESNYDKHGKSETCINSHNQTVEQFDATSSDVFTGQKNTNFVYRLIRTSRVVNQH